MKAIIAVLLCVAAAQAVDLTRVKPMRRSFEKPVPPMMFDSRIIGGQQASDGQFPYQVALTVDNSWFCGASVLSSTQVLTAAHCGRGGSSFAMIFGVEDKSNGGNEPTRQDVTSNQAIVHEDYGPIFIINDVCLITLPAGALALGNNVGTVRLPSRSQANDMFVGATATVSGWGKATDASPGTEQVMKWTTSTVISNTECSDVYGTTTVNDGCICTDTAGGTSGTCSGDSGGPLTITESDGLPTQIGVVSFVASAGCESGLPDGFARTTFFLDWFQTNGDGSFTIRP